MLFLFALSSFSWPGALSGCIFTTLTHPEAGKDCRQKEKGATEDEMVGWHQRRNGCEFSVNSRSWWRTGKPGILQSMGSQRVGHDWVADSNSNTRLPQEIRRETLDSWESSATWHSRLSDLERMECSLPRRDASFLKVLWGFIHKVSDHFSERQFHLS